MAGERQNGMGTAGKQHGNGRETAGKRHGMCESAFTPTELSRLPYVYCPYELRGIAL
jgi:hypothetical protein